MDLTELLQERSAEPAEGVAHHVRMAAVAARVTRRRQRRRAAVAAIGAVAAVLLIAGLTAALRPSAAPRPVERTPTPSPTRLVEGFPEYAQGARVVAAKAAALPTRTMTLTFVPTTPDLVVFDRCDGLPDQVSLAVAITLNGRSFLSGGCGGSFRPGDLAEYGVVAGKRAILTATVQGASRFAETGDIEVAVPAAGIFAMAVGERMSFADYPLPPRPATLRPLESRAPVNSAGLERPGAVVVRADPADPTRAQRLTVTWRAVGDIDMASQTPGLLHVRVNGVEVATGEWWDYEQGGFGGSGDKDWPREYGLTVHPGERVTVEVVPEHVTGDWRVVFVPKE
jgi:hypothetical protein